MAARTPTIMNVVRTRPTLFLQNGFACFGLVLFYDFYTI